MYDSFHRKIDYMRISITDRCNLRCRYCMPEGIDLIPMKEILRYEEILMLVRQAVALGIVKYKITGGEPLVRKGCINLIRQMKNIPGLEQVTLTTNGVLLKDFLPDLKEVGIDGINISLDTMIPEKYADITGYDKFHEVMEGIMMAVNLGLKVKINCVLQKGRNEEEWQDILQLAGRYPLDVRFIELMPIGVGKNEETVYNDILLSRIRSHYPDLMEDHKIHGNGPAVYYHIPGFKGSIGLISAMHGKFCDSCNRIRMTSTGDIKPCLCFEKSISVRKALRDTGADAQEKEGKIRAVLETAISEKPQMHHFEEEKEITEHKKMVQIGG